MDYYKEIKNQILQNEINRIVKNYSINKNDLKTYYNIGKLLKEYQEQTSNKDIIKDCSLKLTNEIGKGYSSTNLKYMLKFYLYFKNIEDLPIELNWSHYVELLSLNSIDEIKYYLQLSLQENLSYRELHRKIKNNEYKKLQDNKEHMLSNNEIFENNYIKYSFNKIKCQNNLELINEIEKQLILENSINIIKYLGKNLCLIDSKYKIKINNNIYYIDLLLYNIEYNCYVVIKLISNKVKTIDINQIKTYINYINQYIKTDNQNKTIGIIIYLKNNQINIKYTTDNRINNI